MAYLIEYTSKRWKTKPIWKKTPTKEDASIDFRYELHDHKYSQTFRITADELEEFGIAIEEFTTQSRLIEWGWTTVSTKYSEYVINQFPSRVNGKWVKEGFVVWEDNRAKLNKAREKKAAEKYEKDKARRKKSAEIKKLKKRLKELGE